MDFNKVKKLIKTVGGRCLIIDGDESFVVMGIDEFKKINLFKGYKEDDISDLSRDELLDKINQDITMWQEAQIDKKANEVEQELTEEDVKIEKVLF